MTSVELRYSFTIVIGCEWLFVWQWMAKAALGSRLKPAD